MNVFLLDVTRHNRGPVQSLINSARAHAAKYEPAEIVWFANPTQVVDATSIERLHTIDGSDVSAMISRLVKEMSENGHSGSTFHVFSWDGPTLGAASALNAPNRVVTSNHFTSLLPPKLNVGARTPPPDVGRPEMTVDDAVQLTKQLLTARGNKSRATALRQTQLRGVLSEVDDRAYKNPASPTSTRLIASVVNRGLQEGWLQRDRIGGKTGNEVIWLGSTEPKAPVVDSSAAEMVESQASTKSIPGGAQRTAEMIEVLKKQAIYSRKEIRDLVLHEIVTKPLDHKPTVLQLIRGASEAAQSVAVSSGVTYDFWYPATQAIMKLLLVSGSLMDFEGREIPNGLTARGTTVCGLKDDVNDRCERYLLRLLILALENVTERDVPSLAHALLKQGKNKTNLEAMIDRLYELIEQLRPDLEEGDDGSFRLRK